MNTNALSKTTLLALALPVMSARAEEPLLRLCPAAYEDGISQARSLGLDGLPLPSARKISNLVCAQDAELPSRKALAAMVFQWGQFIDHDITLVHTGGESMPIPVPAGDPYFDPFLTGNRTIPFHRSLGTGSPREQSNQLTAVIDGSAVYGVDGARTTALRSFSGGKLKVTAGPDGEMPPYNDGAEPLDNANENPFLDAEDLYLCGDVRANEQCGLLAIHTLFVREHNRLCDEIVAANPGLDDEELFQLARRKVAALMQAVTYNEFLPAVMGAGAVAPYAGHDENVDPGISNEFSAAAFRVGHTLLPTSLARLDMSYQDLPGGGISLADAFFAPGEVTDVGIGPFLRGLMRMPLQRTDCLVVDGVRNFLFGPPGTGGLDLAALNIQRGRDHGLAAFNNVRRELGLGAAADFDGVTSDASLALALSTAYDGEVEDIDLWIGGMAEDAVAGSVLGETFQTIWIDQFTRMRDGDPAWFENTDGATNPAPFSPAEIAEINATTLADIIARNTGDTRVSPTCFVMPPPAIEMVSLATGTSGVTLRWNSYLNAEYEIQACGSLGSGAVFEPVMVLTGDSGMTTMAFTDPGMVEGQPRFYRVMQR